MLHLDLRNRLKHTGGSSPEHLELGDLTDKTT